MPTNDGIYGCFIDSAYGFFLIQPVAFSLINAVFGKGVMTVRKGGFLLLLALPLIMKVLEKGVTSAGR